MIGIMVPPNNLNLLMYCRLENSDYVHVYVCVRIYACSANNVHK